MEITREFVMDLLAQVDFDPEFDDRLRSRANEVRPILEEVARGDAEEADDYMRKNAIAMLGVAGDDSSVETLVDLLDAEQTEFRVNAIRSLGAIGSDRAAPALEERLEAGELPPTEEKVLVTSLAEVGRPESVPIIEAFRDEFAEAKEDSPGIERDLEEIDEIIAKLRPPRQ